MTPICDDVKKRFKLWLEIKDFVNEISVTVFQSTSQMNSFYSQISNNQFIHILFFQDWHYFSSILSYFTLSVKMGYIFPLLKYPQINWSYLYRNSSSESQFYPCRPKEALILDSTCILYRVFLLMVVVFN